MQRPRRRQHPRHRSPGRLHHTHRPNPLRERQLAPTLRALTPGPHPARARWTKAAALGQSLARNHPLIDRNKRTAFEAMLLFLDYNGEPYADPHPDDAVAFMLRLATGGYDDAVVLAGKDLKSLLGR
ncbi:Fic family protein [Kitasatospora sp. NPDC098663]|uniref:Fic family protein n=1 Tax=Kitasatospora sp. NPDC098663 TaxID=3364096 RepID=UPI0037F922D2